MNTQTMGRKRHGGGGGGGGGHYEEELRHDVDDARDKGNDGKEEAEASTVYYFPG